MTHAIERIADLPPDFGELVSASSSEQFAALERMRREWDSGANRFDRPGEVLLEARVGSRLAGICGLNRDPYLQSSEVGRVRHLYVHPRFDGAASVAPSSPALSRARGEGSYASACGHRARLPIASTLQWGSGEYPGQPMRHTS